MNRHARPELDLMPPPFAEGFDDWSRGDGTPESPTWETAPNARLVRDDADFGPCLELRTTAEVERIRYMGEMPLLAGGFIEVAVRVRAVRGPLPEVRIAAWPGGAGGRRVEGLPEAGPLLPVPAHGGVCAVRAVVGRDAHPGVDLVWDERVLYAHVGLDIEGPAGAVVRVESVAVRDVTRRFSPLGRLLPGFEPAAREG
ncbi:hypothetical protein [Amaricoccus sp.]|mgnify:CR=1 FL=1|uniref:hypothetical protein n=1 Tax=Amaricoccus sp. TaxID=1872485 RepID=UPI002602DCAD|nr:hypothetical protein [Amaricoccus sp.]HRO11927.1 hypothetical protein [Amaricoccus sp.]